ncbi:site-specific integrase [Natrarchaeobius halalkaliphilus]|uniref:site-specific integrase n=1 Tax=Natrarchaeobius halalkaliphilus TaxID=1679091 RepID=UPI000F531EC3|nr:site-specific integrase [Natrarchaeobius halalkaliphilus]
MTCFEQVEETSGFESLDSAVESYLSELSSSVPDSTFWSHQTVITKLREWISEPSSSEAWLESHQLCQFVEDLAENTAQDITTICGHINTLINFQSFIHQEDPIILKARLLLEVESSSILVYGEIGKHILGISTEVNFQNLSDRLSPLVTYFRERQFGTRGHAYVELILDTCSRPGCVRNLELEDFNSDNDTVTISIPETHLVSSAGLVTQRVANISPETSEALEEFITYGRKEPTAATNRPLLTTSHGRASESTLRREVKQASGNADEYPHVSTPLPHDQVSCVVPSEIWQYSILQHLEGQ